MEYEKSKRIKDHKSKSSNAKEQSSRVSLCLCIFVSLCLIFISGCGQSPKEITKEISTSNIEVSQAMKAAEDVLGQMHFPIEKADLSLGYIRTRPLSGAQFFEFWRSENVGFDNHLLSNLHSTRRIVELNINQQGEDLAIDCKVHVQRLSMPQREITSSAQAYQMFSRSSMYMQRLQLHPEQEAGMAWLELDEDTKLATEILNRISSKIDREYRETSDEAPAARDKL